MSDEITGQGPERSGINRRTVMKGAAWSVPVIVVASAAPAMAQSQPIEPSFSPGTFCKHPGNPKYYHAVFCFTNTTPSNISVNLGNLEINGIPLQAYASVSNAFSTVFVATALATTCIFVDAGEYPNSANGAAYLFFSYTYNSVLYNGSVSGGTASDESLPPCSTGSASSQPGDDPPHPTQGP